nr:muconate cycloisomerase [uncultured bacterium]
MRITRIESFPVRIPLKPERRMISSLGQHTVSDYVVVRVSTDAGIDGVGEATVMPRWSGETVWGATALIDNVLAPAVIGKDPHDIGSIDSAMERATALNWFAKSAIEMACWDIQGKEADKPVYELLGGAVRPLSIRCRFSMGAYDPERARRRAIELLADGFSTFKVKVGTKPAEDIERVRIVREVIGPKHEIVIDANCGWDAPTAISSMEELKKYNIGLFEQPTTNGDYAALAEVRKAIRPTKVMADDIVFDLVHARECIRNNACDVVSLYPGKNGGIARTKQIVDYCASHGVACSIGSNLEWDIASAAMCHVVVACKNMQVETYPATYLARNITNSASSRNRSRSKAPSSASPIGPASASKSIGMSWKQIGFGRRHERCTRSRAD